MGRRISKESPHATITNRSSPPPRKVRRKRPRHPSQLWLALPAADRSQILNALSRVVAEHLALPSILREVTHEQA
jgi:hypothetical protein